MDVWLDNHLSPKLAPWLSERHAVRCRHVREIGLNRSDDGSIFESARRAGACILTRDDDFAELVISRGAPPQVALIVGPTMLADQLRMALALRIDAAFELLRVGEPLVEINLWPLSKKV